MILRLLGIFLALYFVFFSKPALAEEYYFQDEFNISRPLNSLDPARWSTFPNATSGFTTISETGGFVNFTQQNNRSQFPLVISKNGLPAGDFSAEIKFQYTQVTPWGTGIALSQKSPINGQNDFSKMLLRINIWQDQSVPNMRVEFDSNQVYQTAINTESHILRIDRAEQKYLIYIDNQLIYTSPKTLKQVQYIWMGNPVLINPFIPNWTKFKVDYIRVKSFAPEPFLDLPWDYKGKGLDFNEAANSINSFFDHEYPLLSSGINEGVNKTNSVIFFRSGLQRNDLDYSSHDGYDYGKPAKVNNGDPLLAAAAGIATFSNDCGACGNSIHIDHGNGYQTRYYHLQKDGLITEDKDTKINVSEGQAIGKVGSTGNSTGAHIHLMVVQDKNGDGNFDDNIPDGVTDPFGWQSIDDDPWEKYNFIVNGINKSGNRSYYLWKKKIDNLDEALTANGGVFNVGRFQVNMPQGITTQNLNLEINSAPTSTIFENIISVGSTLRIEARNSLGNLITTYPKLFDILVDFKILKLDGFKTETLSFYSSSDGITWTKEPTEVDLINKTAKTSVNHMSYFALAGERLDVISPVTTANLIGSEGQENWFRSDVELELFPQDNEGGLGVDYTLYKIEGGEWETYTSPLLFTDNGHYKVEFYSADLDENIEEINSIEFDIDKILPEVSINASPLVLWPPNGKMWDINITGNSSDDNLFETRFSVEDEYELIEPLITDFNQTIQLEARRDGSDLNGRVYIIKVEAEDLAGNLAQSQIEIIVPHNN